MRTKRERPEHGEEDEVADSTSTGASYALGPLVGMRILQEVAHVALEACEKPRSGKKKGGKKSISVTDAAIKDLFSSKEIDARIAARQGLCTECDAQAAPKAPKWSNFVGHLQKKHDNRSSASIIEAVHRLEGINKKGPSKWPKDIDGSELGLTEEVADAVRIAYKKYMSKHGDKVTKTVAGNKKAKLVKGEAAK